MIRRINLALQGGGAHGAFTWGVLDRILQEDDIEIAAISGTSAGALNAAALKAGIVAGGKEAARENLAWFWGQVGAMAGPGVDAWLSAMQPYTATIAAAMKYSPSYAALDFTSRMFSPYVYGPALRNPLQSVVESLHFEDICCDAGPEIFVGATNVRSGKIRLFSGADLSPMALLASACLPSMFQAVEIEDPATGKQEAYWDGGYTGNPALFPLFEARFPDDILIVNINPLYREELPRDSQSIQNRINEISFNSSLLRELRAIEFVHRLLKNGQVAPGSMKDVRVHLIADDALMNDLNVATKTIPAPVILSRLKDAGIAAADTFLRNHKADINQRGTVDLAAMFT